MTTYHPSTAIVVSSSVGVDELTGLSIPEMVAYMARVSNPSNQNNTLSMPKLLTYLQDNKHWSPFDMVHVTIKVVTSRAIAHQVIRHWSARFQEFSQRYSPVDGAAQPFFWETRMAGSSTRQGSIETNDAQLVERWVQVQADIWLAAWSGYMWALESGIAPEVARAILPEGMTPTTFYMTNNLRSWIHYFDQRLDLHAQKEHRDLAEKMRQAMVLHEPALEDVLPTPRANE